MATNFPDTSINNPNTGVGWANGDAFDDTANSGLIYYWYDPVWKTSLSSADADAKYVEVDGDTMTGDLTVPSLNGGQLAGFRNQIINGGFNVWQRSSTYSVPVGANVAEFTSDRWIVLNSSASTENILGNDDPNSPSGLGILIPSAGTFLFTPLELPVAGRVGPFAGEYTLSFYSTAAVTEAIAEFRDVSVSSANQVQFTVPLPTPTGEVRGAFTRYSTTINFNQGAAGTNLCLIVGAVTSVANQVFTCFQLEPGPVATPFEHRPIGTELALCQRYFQKISALRVPPDQGASSTGRTLTVPRTTTMRVSPTQNGTNGPGVLSVIYAGDEDYLRITGTATVAGSGFDISGFTADAEL